MRKNKSIGKVEKICLRDGCNKTMFIFPSESDTKKYCSNKCKYPPKVEKVCPTCNVKFLVSACRRDTSKFCSIKCQRPTKEASEKRMATISKNRSLNKGPNGLEIKVGNLLNNLHPGKFRFVGTGEVIINRSCPDFISDDNKIVVLANGNYWHFNRFEFDFGWSNEINKTAIELIDALPYLNSGYEVWIVWEDTMKISKVKFENSVDAIISTSVALSILLKHHYKGLYNVKPIFDKLGTLIQKGE